MPKSCKEEKNCKKILIGFRHDIPRQQQAYDILVNERNETGIPYSLIIHEALLLYAEKKTRAKSEPLAPEPESPLKERIVEVVKEPNELSPDVAEGTEVHDFDDLSEEFLMGVLDENFG